MGLTASMYHYTLLASFQILLNLNHCCLLSLHWVLCVSFVSFPGLQPPGGAVGPLPPPWQSPPGGPSWSREEPPPPLWWQPVEISTISNLTIQLDGWIEKVFDKNLLEVFAFAFSAGILHLPAPWQNICWRQTKDFLHIQTKDFSQVQTKDNSHVSADDC